MRTNITAVALGILLIAAPVCGQSPEPFPEPIEATEGVIRVNYREFATIPDMDGQPARMMLLVTEPGTRRMFVSDMRGPLYSISYDGRTVRRYVDTNDARWGHEVQAGGRERGVQSFAFHPQFNQEGAPGYGKFYTWTDVVNRDPTPDFRPGGGNDSHDTVLLEWTARQPEADTYDGGPPRELLRLEQPFPNHNAGGIAFRPEARPGDADYGLLYMGVADGGSGGDPLNLAQNLGSIFGKIIRIDPLGRNSANGKYGIPADNPFVSDNDPNTLGEIWAYGVRNPQRLAWDPQTGAMYMSDIGQNVVEEISPVTRGANLGWNHWEGSFRYVERSVSLENRRGDPNVTYPVAEWDQSDPLLQGSGAATGVFVYRSDAIPALRGRLIFGDMPTGEVFHVSADDPPQGGQSAIRRILFNDDGQAKTFLQLIQDKNREQGRQAATRADMRFGYGPDGQLLLINKYDGVVRLIVP